MDKGAAQATLTLPVPLVRVEDTTRGYPRAGKGGGEYRSAAAHHARWSGRSPRRTAGRPSAHMSGLPAVPRAPTRAHAWTPRSSAGPHTCL